MDSTPASSARKLAGAARKPKLVTGDAVKMKMQNGSINPATIKKLDEKIFLRVPATGAMISIGKFGVRELRNLLRWRLNGLEIHIHLYAGDTHVSTRVLRDIVATLYSEEDGIVDIRFGEDVMEDASPRGGVR